MICKSKLLLLIVLFSIVSACSWTDARIQDSTVTPDVQANKDESPLGFTGDKVRLIGRFDLSQNGSARFTWPGSSMEFRFEGTSAGIRIASGDRVRFSVKVDGEEKELWVTQGEKFYQLASGMKAGSHLLRITRLNESFSGITAFISNPVVQGKLLTPPNPPDRRLLVVGNSITAGYGVEGESEACGYSIETSNPLETYASFAAKMLGADLHIIAWSGIGAWRSYGEKTPKNPTIIDRYSLALADDVNSHWNPNKFIPDAILVNIGTNDYWDGEVPNYRGAMNALIKTIRQDYLDKPIYLIVSPMLSGSKHDSQRAVLDSLASKFVTVLDLGRIETSDGFGCDYHPNTKTQSRMADALVGYLRADLGWR